MISEQLKKDIFLLFIFASGNTLYFSYNVIYPYTFSYLKHFDDSLQVKYFLFNILGIYFGFIIGTSIIPYLFYLLSIRGTMILTCFLSLTHFFIYTLYKSYWWNLAMTSMIGILFEFQIYSVNYYLSSKYDEGILYSGYVFLGQNLNMIYFPLLFQYMMNPNNKTMDQISYGSGNKEAYFSWEISNNFPFVMKIVGVICFICHFTACVFIRNPENIKAHLLEFFKALFKGNRQKIDQIKKDIAETSHSYISQEENSFKKQMDTYSRKMSQQSQEEMIIDQEIDNNENLSENEAQKLSQKAIKHNKVLLLVLIMGSINGALLYFINFLKIPVLLVLKDDQKFSFCLTLSAMFSLTGKVVPGLIWNKLGFYKCYFLYVFLGWFQFLIAFVFRYKNFYFIFLYLTMTRFLLAMKFILIYNLLYKSLNPKVANYISKVFECNYIIGVGSWLTYNNIFFSIDNLYQNINVLLIVTTITMVVFLYNYKDFNMYDIVHKQLILKI